MAYDKNKRRVRVKRGIRKNILGTSERPRLSVFRSNRHIYAQLIDDLNGVTVAAASSQAEELKGSPVDQSKAVGQKLAENAKAAGVESVVFDRNGYRYHGRVQALADGARESGLQF